MAIRRPVTVEPVKAIYISLHVKPTCLVNIHMTGERVTSDRAKTVNQVKDAARVADLLKELRKLECRQRSLLGWFEDDRAPHGQRGGDFPNDQTIRSRSSPCHHEKGIVPRYNLRNHPAISYISVFPYPMGSLRWTADLVASSISMTRP
jgi:hypothetical protein